MTERKPKTYPMTIDGKTVTSSHPQRLHLVDPDPTLDEIFWAIEVRDRQRAQDEHHARQRRTRAIENTKILTSWLFMLSFVPGSAAATGVALGNSNHPVCRELDRAPITASKSPQEPEFIAFLTECTDPVSRRQVRLVGVENQQTGMPSFSDTVLFTTDSSVSTVNASTAESGPNGEAVKEFTIFVKGDTITKAETVKSHQTPPPPPPGYFNK